MTSCWLPPSPEQVEFLARTCDVLVSTECSRNTVSCWQRGLDAGDETPEGIRVYLLAKGAIDISNGTGQNDTNKEDEQW